MTDTNNTPQNEKRVQPDITQEIGEAEPDATIIGMTAGNEPPPGVQITQRIGRMTGGTIIGYDGTRDN